MNHLSEEQIVLHYYGDAEEPSEIERHLAACPECRAELACVVADLLSSQTARRLHEFLTRLGRPFLRPSHE